MPEPMELAYEERGSGPVAVFVHGFPLDRTMWIGVLAGTAKVRTAVAIDLRGNGLSTDTGAKEYSMDLFADDIARTLDVIGADKIDLCGHSMGGYVALAFWRKYPERIRSLIFVNTKAGGDTEEGRKGREATAANVVANGMEAFWEGAKAKYFGSDPSQEALDRGRKMFMGVPPEVAAADALAMRDRPDSTGDLAGINVPALWLAGKDDQLIPSDVGRADAEKITGVRFELIPGGHMAPMEHPAEASAILTDFFKAVGK